MLLESHKVLESHIDSIREHFTNVEIWSTTCRYCIILVVLLNVWNCEFESLIWVAGGPLGVHVIFVSTGLYGEASPDWQRCCMYYLSVETEVPINFLLRGTMILYYYSTGTGIVLYQYFDVGSDRSNADVCTLFFPSIKPRGGWESVVWINLNGLRSWSSVLKAPHDYGLTQTQNICKTGPTTVDV